jgi:GT2 family glycosyltransferase
VGLSFLPFIVGGNLAAWTDVLGALGGFNEAYPRQQDVELSWRAQRSALRLAFAPDAVVHCRERTGVRDIAVQAYRNGRAEPQLYRDFRGSGMPRAKLRRFPLLVGALVVRAPACLTSPARRLGWIRVACAQLGRLTGSVRYRVVYL